MSSDPLQAPVDVAVVGGGPAGIMAALSAKRAHPGYRIIVLDRMAEIGRKILVSGNGRGNLTNVRLATDPASWYSGNHAFVDAVFSQFGYSRITEFFAQLGIPLYEETKSGRGKQFPVVDSAKTVRGILLDALDEAGIEVRCGTTVAGISRRGGEWAIGVSGAGPLTARRIVIAAGGKTYPALGADGSGYELARQLGHRIVEPVPSAVPVLSRNILSHLLQGEKMPMAVSVAVGGRTVAASSGDVMFTQYGISGPAVFDVSRAVSLAVNRDGNTDVTVSLSFFPGMAAEAVRAVVGERCGTKSRFPVAHALWGVLTDKASGAVCAAAGLPKDRRAGEMTAGETDRLVAVLTDFRMNAYGTRGWNEAEFTAGGVATDGITPSTLESMLAPGIHFAGEIIDVDGPVGGFNLSWAWASGWVAGQSV